MKNTFELFLLVDASGDYAVAKTADDAREAYENDIGPLNEVDGFRVVKLAVAVPLPVVIEASAEVADDQPAELTAV